MKYSRRSSLRAASFLGSLAFCTACKHTINAYVISDTDDEDDIYNHEISDAKSAASYFSRWENVLASTRDTRFVPGTSADAVRMNHILRVILLATAISELRSEHLTNEQIRARVRKLGHSVGVSLNCLVHLTGALTPTEYELLYQRLATDANLKRRVTDYVNQSLRVGKIEIAHRRHVKMRLRQALQHISEGSPCQNIPIMSRRFHQSSVGWRKVDQDRQRQAEHLMHAYFWNQSSDALARRFEGHSEDPASAGCVDFPTLEAAWQHTLTGVREHSVVSELSTHRRLTMLVHGDMHDLHISSFVNTLTAILLNRKTEVDVQPYLRKDRASYEVDIAYELFPLVRENLVPEFTIRRVGKLETEELLVSLIDGSVCTKVTSEILKERRDDMGDDPERSTRQDPPEVYADTPVFSYLDTQDWSYDAVVPIDDDGQSILLLPVFLFFAGTIMASVLLTQTAIERRYGNLSSTRGGFFGAVAVLVGHPKRRVECW